jgi:hypothetical protein
MIPNLKPVLSEAEVFEIQNREPDKAIKSWVVRSEK